MVAKRQIVGVVVRLGCPLTRILALKGNIGWEAFGLGGFKAPGLFNSNTDLRELVHESCASTWAEVRGERVKLGDAGTPASVWERWWEKGPAGAFHPGWDTQRLLNL